MSEHNQIKCSIIKTLSYSDIFDYPLNIDEIERYYIGVPVDRMKIRKIANFLVAKGYIGRSKGLFFLNGRKKLVKVRQLRELESRKKIKIAKRIAELISRIPTVKLVGLSGSLSMKNSKKSDDIDLFIVSSHGTLWLTRLLVTIALVILGKRRARRDSFGVDLICLNMIVDEAGLAIHTNRRNIFSAHEVAQLKVLVNKHGSYNKFLSENNWINNFLPNIRIPSVKKQRYLSYMGFLDSIFYLPQYLYMRRKITNEEVGRNIARFHPKDKTKFVISLLNMKYKDYLFYLAQSTDFEANFSSSDTPGY